MTDPGPVGLRSEFSSTGPDTTSGGSQGPTNDCSSKYNGVRRLPPEDSSHKEKQ